ncbi:MAG: N-6 DNA methylase [Phycisphaerae bacterium]|jgi:hypothetical protein
MGNSNLRYNERSWAIDLISFINSQTNQADIIQHAGGEWTLSTENQNLFPDVLLFGDKSKGNVLQGWELKMPDTLVDDRTFLGNAEIKARNLGLDSFIAWNAQTAQLYIRDPQKDAFILYDKPLFQNLNIKTREDVEKRPDLWQEAAVIILNKISSFFISGRIIGVTPESIFSNESFVNQLLSCQVKVKSFIDERMTKDNVFDAKVKLWWKYVVKQYPGYDSPSGPLAYCVLLRWFNRFVFSNILKAYNIPLKDIEKIKKETSIQDALAFFFKISQSRDFWNVLGPADFDEMIPDDVWKVLILFNDFLKQFEFSQIDKSVLQGILKSVVLSSIKKAAGLYVTPPELARLLVLLALSDKNGFSIDPFCGTGTIVKAMLSVKSDFNIPGYQSVQTTWACDKFAFPVQVSTLMISSPEHMMEPLRVFTHDALTLCGGDRISFINPSTGENAEIEIPRFSAIISNLPFIQFEDIDELNQLVNQKIKDFYEKYSVDKKIRLSGRSDFYSYVPFILYDLLEDNGRLGIIVSNSWLSTDWGAKFRRLLQKFYNIEYVITSANGRWFPDTDVVANLLICKKKTNDNFSQITFAAAKKQLPDADIDEMATNLLANTQSDNTYINKISEEQLTLIDSLNIGWTSCFADINWLLEHLDKFELLSGRMFIARGERRGWNPLFYPEQEYLSTIEDMFLQPVLRTLKSSFTLTVTANQKAFCCPYTVDQLEAEGHTGALSWIQGFINQRNKKGKLLSEVLKRGGLEWYQMDANTMADFVLSMNPDERLFIAKTDQPTFVDQRLIRLTRKNNDMNLNLLYALMNSCISMFLIEAIGFGRGLGVLDINSTKIEEGFRIPRLELIDTQNTDRIIEAFTPLCNREAMPVVEEIQQVDRQKFDKTILRSIGIPEDVCNKIYSALLAIYNIRKSVGR